MHFEFSELYSNHHHTENKNTSLQSVCQESNRFKLLSSTHKEHFSHSYTSARIQGNLFASHVKCAQEFKVYFEFRLTNKPKKITTVTMGSEDCSVVEIKKG